MSASTARSWSSARRTQVIGLPAHPLFDTPEARRQALLKSPEELGIPWLADAMRELGRQREEAGPGRFWSQGQAWWGDVRHFDLASPQRLAVAVIVPERDLLVGLGTVRVWTVVVTVAVLGLALLLGLVLARRFSRPVEALVQESDRSAQGDLEPGVRVESSVAEIRRLASAHDEMRRALRALFEMERDLQLARQRLPGRYPSNRAMSWP